MCPKPSTLTRTHKHLQQHPTLHFYHFQIFDYNVLSSTNRWSQGLLYLVELRLHRFTHRYILQAALNNPNVSEEAKEHSRSMINDFEKDPDTQASRENHSENKNESRVLAGHKGTLKSKPNTLWRLSDNFLTHVGPVDPNVSDEAKERSKEILEEHGAL